MNRILTKSLVAASLSAGLVLAGCGSDAGNSGTTGTADTSTGADTTDTTGGGAGSDATDTTSGDTSTSTDTAVDPCSKCADNQDCVDDGAGGKKCEDKKPPCGGPCGTGEICDTVTDKCVKPTCSLPEATVFTGNTNINKVSKLAILDEKNGCDLDDDAVPNNVLGKGLKTLSFLDQANDTIGGAVKDGSIVILLAPDKFASDGTEFTCDLLLGDIDPSTKDCDATKDGACKYTVVKSSYDQLSASTGTCPALVTFDPVSVKDGKLKAGGDKQNFDLNLPVLGINLKLRISRAQLSGDQSDATAWKSTTNGILCGVLAEDDLNAAIDDAPDELLAEAGLDKATIKGLIPTLLKPDIDTDGDGTKDAISVGLSLETIHAEVTGYTAD